MKIIQEISKRYSPMGFSTKSISKTEINTLVEAARWAPSAFNEQPWKFIISLKEDQSDFDRMISFMGPKNQIWAKTAAAVGISIAKKTYSRNNKVNAYAGHDLGMATGNLLAQATSMGIYAHLMAGFDASMAETELGIPDGYEAVAMFALGYETPINTLPEEVQERARMKRIRNPLDQVLNFGKWLNN